MDEARKAGQAVSEVCRRHQIAPGQFYGLIYLLDRENGLEILEYTGGA